MSPYLAAEEPILDSKEDPKKRRIAELESSIRDWIEGIESYSALLNDDLDRLRGLDKSNPLLKKKLFRVGRFTTTRPSAAANIILHETEGNAMKEEELVKLLIYEGCGSGKKMRGKGSAPIRQGLKRSYKSKKLLLFLVNGVKWVRLGPNAPDVD